jgi:pilus assembly protein Flp/PilA
MIEYALLAALIAVALVGVITTLGGDIAGVFTRISGALTGAGAGGGAAP